MDVGNRAAITGLGVLAPNGIGVEAFWDSILACRSGIGLISLFDASGFPVRIAGEVSDFRISDFFELSGNGMWLKPKRMGRHTQLALASISLAFKDAGLDISACEGAPLPLVVGVSTSAIDIIERGKEMMTTRGPGKVSPYIVSACQPHDVACAISGWFGSVTRAVTISSACPAGLDAIAYGADLVRSGRSDMVIVVGADSPITPLTVASFGASGLVPDSSRPPAEVSRPFERDRAGGVMAEGAGTLILENLDHAMARGATPYAEITGYGSSMDRRGDESGEGLAVSMGSALANAALYPCDVDYICAHGPSDTVIDRVETAAIRDLMGAHAYRIPVSSIKGVTGNPLAASAPFQAAAVCLAMRDGRVAPTANYVHPDPECDLDYVPGGPRLAQVQAALLNVHGLGGGNSSMVLERVEAA
jgi:3-oxoacyl-[acyl-carrier-protein] synthase II